MQSAVRLTERSRLWSRANRASCAEVYLQPRQACRVTSLAGSPRIGTAIATAEVWFRDAALSKHDPTQPMDWRIPN